MDARGLPAPNREVPLKFAVPLLTSAILEEDDELQAAWARLLVNAGDAATEMELRTAYIEILRGMSGYDVRNLSKLAEIALDLSERRSTAISTLYPEAGGDYKALPHALLISIDNLQRAGVPVEPHRVHRICKRSRYCSVSCMFVSR
jgi:hypothetical protein